ncbi:hypothetical protein J4G07_06140 [Candidatus Poribacteria bacterium]|nr:hypothetical protein [Candidatus Poribacteria bacterium]
MKHKTEFPSQRLHRFSLCLAFFCSLVLISCGEEHGNWTAVQQEGAYIYGVWHSTTLKRAEQAMQEVFENIRSTSIQPTESRKVRDVGKTDTSPELLLPSDGEILDWVQSRAPSTNEGKTLYRYRAAEPDLFYAYGFQRQAEVEYQTPRFGSKPLILLEIFDMDTPENAFGIYNFHIYPQVKFEWVGSKAILSGGYLRFSKGKYFIQIEGYEFATGIREAMILLAKNIASRIKEPASESPMLTLLPSNKMSGSVKLFRSNWALRQIYNTLPVNVPELSDTAVGVSARYQDNPDLKNWMEAQIVFIIRFPDASVAESAYTAYQDSVMEKALPLEVGTTGPILVNEPLIP